MQDESWGLIVGSAEWDSLARETPAEPSTTSLLADEESFYTNLIIAHYRAEKYGVGASFVEPGTYTTET